MLLESKRFDLSRALVAIYGIRYVGHPRLENLMNLNQMTHRSFMDGKAEAEAFEQKEYVKLHQSTLRKVDVLANIAQRAINGSLKTQASSFDVHGMHPKILVEYGREHWLYSLLGAIALAGGLLRVAGVL